VAVVFVLLGCFAVGAIADFLLENDLGGTAARVYSLFGNALELTEAQVVIGAVALTSAAMLLIGVGIGRSWSRSGHPRSLRGRIAELESENASLRSRAHLVVIAEAVRARTRAPRASGDPEGDRSARRSEMPADHGS
jgi:hypothetical protein